MAAMPPRNPQPEDKGGARLGLLERQRMRSWLQSEYAEIARVNP